MKRSVLRLLLGLACSTACTQPATNQTDLTDPRGNYDLGSKNGVTELLMYDPGPLTSSFPLDSGFSFALYADADVDPVVDVEPCLAIVDDMGNPIAGRYEWERKPDGSRQGEFTPKFFLHSVRDYRLTLTPSPRFAPTSAFRPFVVPAADGTFATMISTTRMPFVRYVEILTAAGVTTLSVYFSEYVDMSTALAGLRLSEKDGTAFAAPFVGISPGMALWGNGWDVFKATLSNVDHRELDLEVATTIESEKGGYPLRKLGGVTTIDSTHFRIDLAQMTSCEAEGRGPCWRWAPTL